MISGRYYAMDRDNRWDRVELAYKALTKGEGVKGTDAAAAVQASYDDGKTDEDVYKRQILLQQAWCVFSIIKICWRQQEQRFRKHGRNLWIPAAN